MVELVEVVVEEAPALSPADRVIAALETAAAKSSLAAPVSTKIASVLAEAGLSHSLKASEITDLATRLLDALDERPVQHAP